MLYLINVHLLISLSWTKVPYTLEDYAQEKLRNPDFYRDTNHLEYGRCPNIPEANVDRMVDELNERYSVTIIAFFGSDKEQPIKLSIFHYNPFLTGIFGAFDCFAFGIALGNFCFVDMLEQQLLASDQLVML